MRIHIESLLRVVFASRVAGGLLAGAGAALGGLALLSAIRNPENDFPWMRFATPMLGAFIPGMLLILFSSILDRGRIRAFYGIVAVALVELLLVSVSVLMTMSYRNAIALIPLVAVMVACGIAWQAAASALREEKRTYTPAKPIPSTAVVIPPPPARKQTIREPQEANEDSGSAMVIEIRRA